MSELARIAVTVDVAVFTVHDDHVLVTLVERGSDPYLGMLALPGGFVDVSEELEAAAARELAEETGLVVPADSLTQLGAYGTPGRDPRGRTVSIVYWAMVLDLDDPVGGSDAAAARLVPVDVAMSIRLAFDHSLILSDTMVVLDASRPIS